MSKMNAKLGENKNLAKLTTNITSKSVFGLLSATSLEQQLLEICKAMGCCFENDDSTKPKSYIGKMSIE